VRDDRLSRAHIQRTALVLDAKQAAENERDLLELGALSRLHPPFGRDHARDAHAGMSRVHATSVLLDLFWLVACGLDDGRTINQSGHCRSSPPVAGTATSIRRVTSIAPASMQMREQPLYDAFGMYAISLLAR
jgi:hypothetical protein